jgi:death-on-curing protein
MTFDENDFTDHRRQNRGAGVSLIQNHPFVDGNKRIGHASMEVFLLNGFEIPPQCGAEQIILNVASGALDQVGLSAWLRGHIVPKLKCRALPRHFNTTFIL